MPRLPRIHLDGAIYFVTSKAAEDQEIFKDMADYKMYLELLSKYKQEHKFRLYSYSLMPDRLSLLIETGDDATISEIMHDINSLYTKYFNGRYKRHGHVFEARFKSVLVEKVSHLLEMTRYTHRAQPSDSPYSSYSIYVYRGGEGPQPLAPGLDIHEEIQEVLNFLKNKDDENAYRRYCLDAPIEDIKELAKKLKHSAILGSESFVEQVQNRIKEYSEEKKQRTLPGKPSPVFIFVIGLTVVVAAGFSIYFYVSRSALENKFDELLKTKELEFVEKTKFENRSPLAPTELEGTQWTLELVQVSASNGSTPLTIKDTIRFIDGRFSSEYFGGKDFKSSSYFLVPRGSGLTQWQTAQSNALGHTLSWRGLWTADAMKGTVSIQESADKVAQDYSFYSVGWTYEAPNKTTSTKEGDAAHESV